MNNIKSITNFSNNITEATNNISTIATNTIKNTGRIINTIYNLTSPIYDGVKKGFTEKIKPAKSITSKLPIMNVKQTMKNSIPKPNIPISIAKPSFKGGKRTIKKTLKRRRTIKTKNKIKPKRRTLKIKTRRKKSNK